MAFERATAICGEHVLRKSRALIEDNGERAGREACRTPVRQEPGSRGEVRIMNAQRTVLSLLLLLTGLSGFATANADEARFFSGTESGRTPVFETSGPWLLDWSIQSDYAQMTNFELRLYDAATDEFVGTIAQLEGTGRGLKLFEDAGQWQLQVVSQALTWQIEIAEIGSDRAAALRRASQGEATLEDKAAVKASRVPGDAFVSWRPVDDSTLLLFAGDEATGFRISFDPPCPGLSDAKALSFVSVTGSGPERFDSIMLEDGTRCYFRRVVPSVFD
jgi:hypothetical protein